MTAVPIKATKKKTNGAIKHLYKPMLATLISEPFNNDRWIFEPKWDGYRAIAYINNKTVQLLSRNNKSFNETYPAIVHELQKINADIVLDGEIIMRSKKGYPDFQLLQNYPRKQEGNLQYCVFDILELNGKDISSETLVTRKQLLNELFNHIKSRQIINTPVQDTKGTEAFKQATGQHLEGIVAKQKQSIYHAGKRGKWWLKIKTHLRQEAIIAGYTAPQGSRKHLGALILGVYANKKLLYVGNCGTGFNQKTLTDLYELLHPLEINKCPFEHIPFSRKGINWLKPVTVCEIKFAEWTSDGNMRQAVFIGLRQDKFPHSVKKEIPL